MQAQQRNFLSVIKSGLNNNPFDIAPEFDGDEAILTAMHHHLDILFYYGTKKSKVSLSEGSFAMLQKRVIMLASLDARQELEIKKLYKSFNNEDIQYMPLKGAIIKEYYPSPEMRYMGDIDVLVNPSQYKKIKTIMENMGFAFVVESDHEYVWEKKNTLRVELHKRLIPSYNEDFYDYYKDGWHLAKEKTENGYIMADEDFLIYIFTHLAKHYRDGGVGIKHFIDLWVYLSEKPELDYNYIENELAKLDLFTFYKNVLKMLDVWFCEACDTEMSDFLTEWIFSGGAYGSNENKDKSKILKHSKKHSDRKNLKLSLFIERIFPSASSLSTKYAILRKAPVLLPFIWIVRIADALLFRRNKIKNSHSEIRNLEENNISEYEKALEKVGLNYSFK